MGTGMPCGTDGKVGAGYAHSQDECRCGHWSVPGWDWQGRCSKRTQKCPCHGNKKMGAGCGHEGVCSADSKVGTEVPITQQSWAQQENPSGTDGEVGTRDRQGMDPAMDTVGCPSTWMARWVPAAGTGVPQHRTWARDCLHHTHGEVGVGYGHSPRGANHDPTSKVSAGCGHRAAWLAQRCSDYVDAKVGAGYGHEHEQLVP